MFSDRDLHFGGPGHVYSSQSSYIGQEIRGKKVASGRSKFRAFVSRCLRLFGSRSPRDMARDNAELADNVLDWFCAEQQRRAAMDQKADRVVSFLERASDQALCAIYVQHAERLRSLESKSQSKVLKNPTTAFYKKVRAHWDKQWEASEDQLMAVKSEMDRRGIQVRVQQN